MLLLLLFRLLPCLGRGSLLIWFLFYREGREEHPRPFFFYQTRRSETGERERRGGAVGTGLARGEDDVHAAGREQAEEGEDDVGVDDVDAPRNCLGTAQRAASQSKSL